MLLLLKACTQALRKERGAKLCPATVPLSWLPSFVLIRRSARMMSRWFEEGIFLLWCWLESVRAEVIYRLVRKFEIYELMQWVMTSFDYWQLKVLDRCLKCFHLWDEVFSVCRQSKNPSSTTMGSGFEDTTNTLLLLRAENDLRVDNRQPIGAVS